MAESQIPSSPLPRGEEMRERQDVFADDTVRANSRTAAEDEVVQLAVIAGPDAGTVFAIPVDRTWSAGRGTECDGVLNDPSCSRLQFEIRCEGGLSVLVDSGSRWGMTVNGHSVTRHELQPGDVIRVGDTELRWGLAANPAVTTISPMRHVSEARSETSAPTLAPDALLGQSVEHYRIQQLESRTRTGVVFRATDRDSGAMIAFKVFWPELMDNAAVRDRFLQAIRTMQPLRHENLVVLFDAGVTDGLCWIASEFVIGESAKQMIQRAGVSGMLDWKPVLRIATDIAKGLEFAASQGVVHRNITPTNILIRKADGVAKLGDLMLAKALDSLGVAKVTRAADIIGDLPYLSPEQTVGERLDARSDLYSLGATIYALLTGRPPCEGLTTAETVLKIQTQRPEPPTKFHLSIPALFEGVVMRLLAKRPDDRFADATQLLRELDRVDRYTQPVVSRNAPPDADLI